jgi:ankyrin repeat protein
MRCCDLRQDVPTPLHLACQYGRVKVVPLLLKAGAPLEARDWVTLLWLMNLNCFRLRGLLSTMLAQQVIRK